MRLSLCLILFLSMTWNPPLSAARRLYLTIGIDQYQDPYWTKLRFASKDAADVAKALESTFDGGVVLSSETEKDRLVSKADVLRSLAQLEQENFEEDDTVLIYLSAHGTIGKSLKDGRSQLEKVIVTAETESDAPSLSGVTHSQLLEVFQRLKSRRKVLILDTCYSGSGKSKLNQKILDLLARQKGSLDESLAGSPVEGSIILSASAWGEEALESTKHSNGLYTHYLLEGFQQDLNQDGAISISEAHHYASRKVIEETQGRQHPTARIEVVGTDPIIVRGEKKQGSPLLFAYEQMMRKLKVELNGKEIQDLKKGGASVPAGSYQLTIRDLEGKVLLVKDIRLEEGREYSLARFLEYKPEHAFRLGLAQLWLHQELLQQRLGSHPFNGLVLSYLSDSVLGGWHGEFSVFRGFKNDKTDSKGLKINQDLTWNEGNAQLFQRWYGSDFRVSGIKHDPDYYLSLGFGTGFLYLERQLSDVAFLKQTQSLFRPQGNILGEFGWDHGERNLRLALKAESFWLPSSGEDEYPKLWHWSKLTASVGWTF